ncbi:class IIb bacteriocin, lactobin A/cerein 7B family [Flavobacterium amniphilum]|uniref:class IIb bacteriocin, lactobin A/cerein 7B family n=1 Tax=Flavobacterium amniphilum TaxID=1834035 RepID=UPI00202A0CE4|nr:class IIb bacteriocin, lactobin A/cerein 7B family [Flavobacterium amniphilum]MCL9805869.1 class IIb bacteriocin, lactobin A/cerein 7B family [Flavobacterium amniphilum]
MKNLENLNLVELNAQEMREVEGGLMGEILGALALAGGAMAWAFEKGEAYGRSLAN